MKKSNERGKRENKKGGKRQVLKLVTFQKLLTLIYSTSCPAIIISGFYMNSRKC